MRLINESGKRWKQIASALKPFDRTPAMVRNRYLRIERGKWLTAEGKSKNRCGLCGQLKRGHVCNAPRTLRPGLGMQEVATGDEMAPTDNDSMSASVADGETRSASGDETPPMVEENLKLPVIAHATVATYTPTRPDAYTEAAREIQKLQASGLIVPDTLVARAPPPAPVPALAGVGLGITAPSSPSVVVASPSVMLASPSVMLASPSAMLASPSVMKPSAIVNFPSKQANPAPLARAGSLDILAVAACDSPRLSLGGTRNFVE